MQKNAPHPGRHAVVCGGRAVVDVDGEDGDDNGEGDEDHGEEQVLPDEGDDLRGGRDDLLYHKQEDSERHQDGGGERQFLSFVWRKIKHQHGQERQAQAGDDQKQGVEQRQPLQDERVCDEGIRVEAVFPVPLCPCGVENLPLAVVKEVLPVHVVVDQDHVHHVAVVRPGAELHGAVLPVEREEGDVHGAGWLVAGRRRPGDGAVELDNGLGHQGAFEAPVSTGDRSNSRVTIP